MKCYKSFHESAKKQRQIQYLRRKNSKKKTSSFSNLALATSNFNLLLVVSQRLTISMPGRHFCRLRVDCQSDIFVIWGLTARRNILLSINYFSY